MVHPTIEKTCKSFAQGVLRLDNRLMVPHDDRMTVESQSPKQDDGFDAQSMGGVEHAIGLAAGKDFPSGDKHITQSLVGMLLMVPHHIDIVVSQLQSAIKEVRGESPLFPFSNNTLCVLGVVEINSFAPLDGPGEASSAQPTHPFHEGHCKGT